MLVVRALPPRPARATAALLVLVVFSLALGSPSRPQPGHSEESVVEMVAAVGSAGCSPAPHCAPASAQNSFYDFFSYIRDIPDTVLNRGDAATSAWIRAHPRAGTAPGNGSNQRTFAGNETVANPYRCSLAVAALLVTTGLPALKILKIKKAIEALGGVGQAVRLVVGATSAAEKGTAVLNALKDLVAELLGIAAVEQYCFS